MSERPLRIERRLVIRGYEMNATGAVSLSTLARYTEHVRWEGFRDTDYGLCEYWSRGVIRAQKLELLKPARYGMELRIWMWVGRIGRTSLDLVHRIENASDGQLVARTSATVVNLGSDGKPKPIDAAANRLLVTDMVPDAESSSEPAPPGAFRRELIVSPSDLDVLQHVNHARYIDYIEDTRQLAARASAYGPEAASSRTGRRLVIEYEREATLGEPLSILTWPASSRPKTFNFEIRRAEDDSLITRARVGLD